MKKVVEKDKRSFSPKCFADVNYIVDVIKPNHFVVVNLEEILALQDGQVIARRIIDYLAGACYVLKAHMSTSIDKKTFYIEII